MDRVNLSFASPQLSRDLHLSASTYGFGAGLFFLSYAACQLPANLILLRFGARRWLSFMMLAWGVLSGAMMLVRGPTSFYAIRFFLGVAEAGFFPGVIYFLTLWFPVELRARSICWFYLSIPLSSVAMGSIAGTLLGLNGRLGLAGWQWLFLIEAIPAILLSAFVFSRLSDNPSTATWLSPEERVSLVIRLNRANPQPSDGKTQNWGLILQDKRIWAIGLYFLFTSGSFYAYTFSAPAIISNLTGLNSTKAGFVIAAYSVIAAIAMLLNSIHSDRHREIFLHVLLPCTLMALGFAISGLSRSPLLIVISLGLAIISVYAAMVPATAIPSTFLSGNSMALGFAAVNTLAITGGFLGPYCFGFCKDLTGGYQMALLMLTLPCLAGALMVTFLRQFALSKPTILAETSDARPKK
jgi:ACS family tartrate transporter-like MFS transporter